MRWSGRAGGLMRWRARRRMAVEARDLLAAAGAVFDTSLDHRETMRTIARTAVPRLADMCVIDLLRADGTLGETVAAAVEERAARRVEQERAEYPLDRRGEHPVARALRSGQPVVVSDLTEPREIEQVAQSESHRELMASAGYRSAVVMPLFARGRLLGGLSFLYLHDGRRYDPEHLSLMSDLASRAAMALDNAKLYEERAHVAQTLQRSLRPEELPRLQGVELASVYHPVGEHTEVGGDFYDVFQAPSGCWLVVGDICGKGPDAAAVTALVRHSIRALAHVWPNPALVLNVVNDVMLGHGLQGRFATAVVVRLDLSNHEGPRALVAGAGHPPPVLVDAGGRASVIQSPGMLLGISDELRAREVEVALQAGSTIVLYTDGLLDAGAPRSEVTPQQLCRLLEERRRTPQEVAQELEQLALSSGEGALRDDVAILVARVGADSGLQNTRPVPTFG